jgi:hypothetical protein
MRYTRIQVLAKFQLLFGEGPEADGLLHELDRYGSREDDREVARVQLAILKLSDGDPELLRHNVGAALTDYRDVLAWAEYPEELDAGPGRPPEEVAEIRRRDRAQYESWLANEEA